MYKSYITTKHIFPIYILLLVLIALNIKILMDNSSNTKSAQEYEAKTRAEIENTMNSFNGDNVTILKKNVEFDDDSPFKGFLGGN